MFANVSVIINLEEFRILSGDICLFGTTPEVLKVEKIQTKSKIIILAPVDDSVSIQFLVKLVPTMTRVGFVITFVWCFASSASFVHHNCLTDHHSNCIFRDNPVVPSAVQLGPRPFYLLNDMEESPLKDTLTECAQSKLFYKRSEETLGHRGAALFFPEHSKQSYVAAASMGAGVIECDVTFTKDKELVCRHSQCDLHTTTDILLRSDLAHLCTQQFVPAVFDPAGNRESQASAKCCTSDINLEQFKSLKAKMDGADPNATTVEDYVAGGVPTWRTDLFAANGTVMTHTDSIELFKAMGVKMIPELKQPMVPMPFDGFTVEAFAQKIVDDYKQHGVDASQVYLQSMLLEAIKYWVIYETDFGDNALYLWEPEDASEDFRDPATWPNFSELASQGVKTLAPPMYMLIDLKNKSKLIVSDFAIAAKQVGLVLKSWTLERSGSLYYGGGSYYQTVNGDEPANRQKVDGVIHRDGDVFTILDFLFQAVGIAAIFTDWASTVVFYTNCIL